MPIAEALVKANKAKGIMVEVILNRGKANFPIADYLNSNGIPVKIDSHHTNHNKVMVIDGLVELIMCSVRRNRQVTKLFCV